MRLTSELRAWLIWTAAFAVAWIAAYGLVRFQLTTDTGVEDNPDQFFGFPPPSVFLVALLLVPSTVCFMIAAAIRILCFLFYKLLSK